MEGGHLSEFVPIVNSLGHNEKHRNQLTDYGANVVEKEFPIVIFSRLGMTLGKWERFRE